MEIPQRPVLFFQASQGNKFYKLQKDTILPENKAFSEYNKQKQANYNEVYNHESAHLRAAGSLAGSGIVIDKNSQGDVIGGHVLIKIPQDVNKSNPQKTLADATQAKKAALAPITNLSKEDLAVASKAESLMQKARSQISNKKLNLFV